jgi:threonyl-tRNA synthetase
VAILPFNEEKEVKNYCERLAKELEENNLRAKIFFKKKLKDRIRQMYQKKIPCYLVVGKEELEKKILKLIYTYQEGRVEELVDKELCDRFKKNIKHNINLNN